MKPDSISIARAYKLHLNELMIDIKERHVLKVPVAHIHVIEFKKKRGLPHCHMLIMLRQEDKIRTKEQIDNIVSAEIPPVKDPKLRELVRTFSLQAPVCG